MPLSEVSATVHSAPAQVPGTAVQPASTSQHDLSFHDILHALNPLHYLPIIGTVYRAATGDVIPEPLRVGGSMLVSGLLSGPIGLIVNIAMTLAEKATGVDPEKIVAEQLRPAAEGGPPAGATPAAAEPVETVSRPFNPQQLAAYGIRTSASDVTDVNTADQLNSMELSRLRAASAAYARQVALSGSHSGPS